MSSEDEAYAIVGGFITVYIIMAVMLVMKLGLIAGLLVAFTATVVIGVIIYFIREEVG
jgi:hypothetical protein